MAENVDNKKEFPLLGVILCCTSIPPEDRSNLAATASQMGALHKLDLTSDVTHLIVGDTDTPKYKFVAKERPDVKCVLPSWIDAVRQSWLIGGETKVEALEVEHKVPTLYGLRICVTGFEDSAYRKSLENLVNDNGGEYHGNLTKDVTHLIAKVPSGTKYTHACNWKLKVVSIEWLMQSVERGMILEETFYNLLLPESERGQNAWVRKTVSSISVDKRARDEEVGSIQSRKLRRTASAKLSSQNIGLWSDIVNQRTGIDISKQDDSANEQKEIVENDVIVEAKTETQTKSLPIKEEPGFSTLCCQKSSRQSEPLRNWHNKALFRGRSFYMHGFNAKQCAVLKYHLTSHQAEIISDIEHFRSQLNSPKQVNTHLLVFHKVMACDIPNFASNAGQPLIVTDLWVERCLHQKEFVDPKMNCTNTPFPKFPLTGFEKLIVCSTAFKDVDLLHIFKAVTLMGATYDESLSQNASVLVCNGHISGSEKLDFAARKKIPIVTANWLWDSIRIGASQSFDQYLIQPLHIVRQKPNLELVEKGRKDESKSDSPERSRIGNEGNAKGRSLVGRIPDASMSEILARQVNLDKGLQRKKNENNGSPTEDDAQLNVQNQEQPSLQAPGAPTIPLQEISLNSSPTKPTFPSPLKSEIRPGYKDEGSLGPAISSLLAHHQRSAANSASNPTTEAPKINRRRRQLFGRAPSGISARSTSSIGISRASSIDTVNTDGLGTPLDSSNSHARNGSAGAFAALWAYEEQEPAHESPQDFLQMTQLGYEDPDVQLWRERVVEKLGGAKEIEPDKAAELSRRAESIGVVRDAVRHGDGVSKRTRQALGK